MRASRIELPDVPVRAPVHLSGGAAPGGARKRALLQLGRSAPWSTVTEDEQREEGDLLLWGRFFRAKTDEELEAVAMANPALNKACEVLERVSADPVAQDLARKRQLARITWQMDLQGAIAEGEARGRVTALRATITDLCELLGVSLDAERSAWIAGLDEPGLESLRARLKAERRWPSGEAP